MPKILLAVDDSEHSIHTAAKLAELAAGWTAVELHVLNVQADPIMFGEAAAYLPREQAHSLAEEYGTRALEATLALLHKSNLSCSSEVRFGDPAETIVGAAQALECRLIVIGSQGAGALGGVLLGSVTTQVIHLSLGPVLVVPPAGVKTGDVGVRARHQAKILVPTDGSSGALAALRGLIRIVPWFEVAPEIHLLAVYDRTPLKVELEAMLHTDALREYQAKQFDAALKQAREALAGTALSVVEHTAIGLPAEEIRLLARSHHCDLICMGTRGMGTIRNLVLGSIATKVLHRTEVPVLLMPLAKS